MTFPPIGVTAVIAGMAVFNRDAAIVEGRLLNIGRVTRQLESESTSALGGAATAFTGMANAAAAAATIAAGAAVFAGAAAINMAGDFDQGLKLTQALSGSTAEQMSQLTDVIINLTRTGTLGMDDLNKAALELARAGVPIEDVMGGALQAVQDLTVASGGEIGLEKAAKLTATAMNAFGLSVDEVDRVTTAAAVVAQNSALTFTDFGTAVQYAAPQFKAAGFSIEDLAVAEALLGKNGITGSVAATSLRGVIQRLIRPSKDAQKVMDEYGISLFDAEGKSRTFEDLLQQLHNAFSDEAVAAGKLTEEQRLQAISTLGLQRTGAAFLILANATTDQIQELRDSFNDLRASELVNIVLDTFNNQLTIAFNNVKALAVIFGDEFLGGLNDAAKGLVAFLQGIKAEDVKAFANAVRDAGLAIIQAIGGAIQTVRDFIDAFGLAEPIINFAKNALIGLGAVIATSIIVSVGSMILAWGSFLVVIGVVTTAVMALAGPFQELIGKLPSLGDILDGIGKKLDEVGAAWAPWAANAGVAGEVVSAALSGLHGVVESLQFILQGNFTAAAESANKALANFGDAGKGIGQIFQTQVLPVLQRIGEAFKAFGEAVVAATGFLIEHKDIVEGVIIAFLAFQAITAVIGVVSGVLTALAGVIATVVAAVASFSAAIAASGTVLGAIVAILGGPVTLVIAAIAILIGVLAAAWINNWGDIQGKTAAVIGFLSTAIPALASIIGDTFQIIGIVIQQTWDKVQSATQAVWNAIPANIKEDVSAIITDVGDILGLLPDIATTQFNNFINAAFAVLNPGIQVIVAVVTTLTSMIIAALTQLVGDAGPPVQSFVTSVGDTILQYATYAINAALQLGGQIVSGLVQGIFAQVGQITAAARSMVESALAGARDAAGAHSPARETEELGQDLDEGLQQGIEDNADSVVQAGGDVIVRLSDEMVAQLDAAKRPIRGSAASLVDDLLSELASIQSKGETLLTDMQSKMSQIGEDVGRKINEAIINAADAIAKTIEDANNRIEDMRKNLGQSRSDRARRDALSADQDARRTARKRQEEDADAATKKTKDLADAEFQHQQDLANATTQKQRDAANQKYNDKVADINREFLLDQQASADKRKREDEDAQFERDLAQETRDLNDQLENEALQRSIDRTIEERDARVAAINDALAKKEAAIRAQADKEIAELHENVNNKIHILETEFANKAAEVLRKGGEQMRPLVDNIQNILSGNFEAMRSAADDFTKSINDAIHALEELEAKRRQAQFHAPSLPDPTEGLGPGTGPNNNAPPIHGEVPPEFQHGGMVPGPYGKPILAIVHGGEFIAGLDSQVAKWMRSGTQYQAQPNTYNLNVSASYGNYESEADITLDMRSLIAMARG